MRIYRRGATAVLRCQSYNSKTNVATTPGTSIKITVKNPVPTAVVSAQAMSNDDTGDHSYAYDIAADAVVGEYEYEVVTVNATRTSVATSKFRVEARI